MHTASSLNTTPLRLFGHTAHTRAESPISCVGGVAPPHSNHAHPLHTSYPAPWSSRYTGIHCLMASPSYITTSSYFFLIVMTKIWIVFSRHICINIYINRFWLSNYVAVQFSPSRLSEFETSQTCQVNLHQWIVIYMTIDALFEIATRGKWLLDKNY